MTSNMTSVGSERRSVGSVGSDQRRNKEELKLKGKLKLTAEVLSISEESRK